MFIIMQCIWNVQNFDQEFNFLNKIRKQYKFEMEAIKGLIWRRKTSMVHMLISRYNWNSL